MKYEDWVEGVASEITNDPLWRVTAYRLALFGSEVSWHDATKLVGDRRTLRLSDQLYRAVGSIGANIAEGYSRSSAKDRTRFYEYALGSAREARHWYYGGRFILGAEVTAHRLNFLTEIIRLLLTMVPQERGYALRDEEASYRFDLRSSDQEKQTILLHSFPF